MFGVAPMDRTLLAVYGRRVTWLWVFFAGRAAWLLPDWLMKWDVLLRPRRLRRRHRRRALASRLDETPRSRQDA
jgi:hypothetical protein